MNWEVWDMSLKTFLSEKLFSKALIKADIRNHWPWPVAAFVVLVFNFILMLDRGMPSENYTDAQIFDRFMDMFSFAYIFALFYGLFMGIKLFMYLDKINSVSCMHGLPFSRRKLYLSHIASGAFLTLLPAAVMTVIMLLVGVPFERTYFLPECCLSFFTSYTVYSLIAFAIAVFAMTVCGNVLVSVLFSGFIAALPAALIGFFVYIGETSVYGYYVPDMVEDILYFLYVFPDKLFPAGFLTYLVGGILFLVAGYFIYKIRPLENCEEVVAFKKLRPLFVFAVGLVMGMISHMFLSGLVGMSGSLLTMLPLGIVGVVGAAMIARKSVRLKGTWVYTIIYVCLVVYASLSVKYDFLGYERRLPDADKIEYIETNVSGSNHYHYDNWLTYDKLPDYRLTTEEEIETARALHAAYIAQKNDSYGVVRNYLPNVVYDDNNHFTITYKLKNGATVKRNYHYLREESFEQYKLPLLNLYKVKAARWPVLDEVEKEIVSVTAYDDRISIPAVSYYGTNAERIIEALKYDLINNSYEDLYTTGGALSLRIEFYVPATVKATGKRPATVAEKDEYTERFTVQLNKNYERTLDVLGIVGYEITNRENFEAVEKIVIRNARAHDRLVSGDYEDLYYEDYYYETGSPVRAEVYETKEFDGDYIVGKSRYDATITDKDDMLEIYEYTGVGFEPGLNLSDIARAKYYRIYLFNFKNEIFYSQGFSVIPENLPAHLQQYFVK